MRCLLVLKVRPPLLAAILTCTALSGQSLDIQLSAKLDTQSNQLRVALKNESTIPGTGPYYFKIGTLCGPYGAPAFQFTLDRKGLLGQSLVLVYNQNPKSGQACKSPLPWVVALPRAVQYTFTFPLSDLHVGKYSGSPLSALKVESYRLKITYNGAVTSDFEAKWNGNESPALPFWRGTVSAIAEADR